MGFFSWKTADTKKSISNMYSSRGTKTVYLLRPNGKEPIIETQYEGYGEFGGVDAYEWLAENNIEDSILKMAEKLGMDKRMLGIYMDSSYYIDTRSGKKYAYKLSELFDDLNPFPENYQSKVDGIVINDLIKDGTWKKRSFADYFGEIKFPLKFSYNRSAVYEDLPASENDEAQGFFY